MTSHEFLLLLHYNDPEAVCSDVIEAAIPDLEDQHSVHRDLFKQGLIDSSYEGYYATARGRCLIEHIFNLPLPEIVYHMPGV